MKNVIKLLLLIQIATLLGDCSPKNSQEKETSIEEATIKEDKEHFPLKRVVFRKKQNDLVKANLKGKVRYLELINTWRASKDYKPEVIDDAEEEDWPVTEKYWYNKRGYLEKKTITGSINSKTTTYNYDQNNRLASEYESKGKGRPELSCQYKRDSLGRLIKKTVYFPNGLNVVLKVFTYQYYGKSNVPYKSTAGLPKDKSHFDHIYDDNGRLVKKIRWKKDWVDGKVKKQDWEEWQYGQKGERVEQETTFRFPDAQIIMQKTFSYDRFGNKVKETEKGSILRISYLTKYTYDNQHNWIVQVFSHAHNKERSYITKRIIAYY